MNSVPKGFYGFLALAVGVGAALVAPSLVSAVQAQTPPVDIIAVRQATMKHMYAYEDIIKAAMAGEHDLSPAVDAAQAMADWGRQIPAQFPPGSATGATKSGAKPEIWTDNATFLADAADLATQGDKLVQLAKAGDRAGVVAQFTVTNETCNTCHKSFRMRK